MEKEFTSTLTSFFPLDSMQPSTHHRYTIIALGLTPYCTVLLTTPPSTWRLSMNYSPFCITSLCIGPLSELLLSFCVALVSAVLSITRISLLRSISLSITPIYLHCSSFCITPLSPLLHSFHGCSLYNALHCSSISALSLSLHYSSLLSLHTLTHFALFPSDNHYRWKIFINYFVLINGHISIDLLDSHRYNIKG